MSSSPIRILLLSDTHSYIDKDILHYVSSVDEVWHAGDIGVPEVLHVIETEAPMVRFILGNIDVATDFKNGAYQNIFTCGGLRIFMVHIGGYPGRYARGIPQQLDQEMPDIFISGHSHILKVMPDKKRRLLHINPGAAGKHGFHIHRTMVRFDISRGAVENLQVVKLGKRSAI